MLTEVSFYGIQMTWFVLAVGGYGQQWILAEDVTAAETIARLAFTGSSLGKIGYAKVLPTPGTMVTRQVPAESIVPGSSLTEKDERELVRRGGINYERSGL